MNITINDKTIVMPDGATLQNVLDEQNIQPKGIATAVNGVVVPAKQRLSTVMKDGDSIVVIKAFYGG